MAGQFHTEPDNGRANIPFISLSNLEQDLLAMIEETEKAREQIGVSPLKVSGSAVRFRK